MGEAETHNETTKTAKSNKDNPGAMIERKEEQLDWEELRKIVRQLETEIYQRLVDYGQLQSDLKSIDDNDVSQLSKTNDLCWGRQGHSKWRMQFDGLRIW